MKNFNKKRIAQHGKLFTTGSTGILSFTLLKRIMILFGMKVTVSTRIGLDRKAKQINSSIGHAMTTPGWIKTIHARIKKVAIYIKLKKELKQPLESNVDSH